MDFAFLEVFAEDLQDVTEDIGAGLVGRFPLLDW